MFGNTFCGHRATLGIKRFSQPVGKLFLLSGFPELFTGGTQRGNLSSGPVLTHVPPIHSPPHLLQIQIGMPTNEKVKRLLGVSPWDQAPTYGSKNPLARNVGTEKPKSSILS